jgi:5-methylcytosine-specific restriction endonuclease McrA
MSKRSQWIKTLRLDCAISQNWRCHYCKRPMTEPGSADRAVTLEHRVPRSLGGKDNFDNCVAACRECNTNKSDALEDEFYRPSAPPTKAPRQHDDAAAARELRKRRERSTMWRQSTALVT